MTDYNYLRHQQDKEQRDRGIVALITIIGILLFVPIILLNAFTASKLWEWFVAPVFGLQLITIVQAYGLSIFYHYFVVTKYDSLLKDESSKTKLENAKESLIKLINVGVFRPIVALIFGFIVYRFFV